VTGFPPGTVDDGTIEINTPLAQQAHTDATDAFVDLAARTPTQDLSGTNLGGLTLTPGVYKFTNAAQLTGALTLDAENNVSASFVFQVGTTMTFDPASTVTIINVSTLNVAAGNLLLWQVGTTVSIGAGAALTGSIVAAGDITAGAAATMTDGRLLSLGGTVALDTDTLAIPPALAEGLTTGELEIYVRFH
jgi:type VI secretion system secreted protein VgrG